MLLLTIWLLCGTAVVFQCFILYIKHQYVLYFKTKKVLFHKLVVEMQAEGCAADDLHVSDYFRLNTQLEDAPSSLQQLTNKKI